MKKFIISIVIALVSISASADVKYSVINVDTDNVPVHDIECVSNTDYWVNLVKGLDKAEKDNADKYVIKYDGKWKYCVSGSENMITFEIILSHFTSGTNIKDGSFQKACKDAFEKCKEDKIVVTIR